MLLYGYKKAQPALCGVRRIEKFDCGNFLPEAECGRKSWCVWKNLDTLLGL